MKNLIRALPPQVLRARLGRICVALTGDTIGEMLANADLQVKENPFMEFRLDYLDNPLAALPRLKRFLSENSVVTAVGTCRRVSNGGRFKGSSATQIEILRKAIEAGCQLIDVELETATAAKKSEIDSLRDLAAVILSFHDYEATEGLDAAYERMRKFTPDFIKLVSTARSLHDNVTMIRFLEKVRDEANVIGTCMGDAGIISRVLGVRAGSEFTFAAASLGEETAPGQIAARTLRETYRIDQVEQGTKVYGVAGSPVKQSLSPLMMNIAFRRETFNAVYLQLQTTKIKDLLALVDEIPLQGFSVTMPLKQDIMKHLFRTNALTAKVGACNMVVRAQDGKLIGYNTDVIGIVDPLSSRVALKGAKILVLGAGGAARAAVFALREREADVYITNRTGDTATRLAREAKAKTFRKDQLAKAQWDVIINATPVGMADSKQQTWLEPDEVNARIVFDMVYDPPETPLIRMARQKGLQVITGAEMFVAQGAEQFQIWTGKPAPRDEMMRTVNHALIQRHGVPEPVVVEKPILVKVPVEKHTLVAAKTVATKAVTAKTVTAKTVTAKTVTAKTVAPKTLAAKAAPVVPVTKAALVQALAAKAAAVKAVQGGATPVPKAIPKPTPKPAPKPPPEPTKAALVKTVQEKSLPPKRLSVTRPPSAKKLAATKPVAAKSKGGASKKPAPAKNTPAGKKAASAKKPQPKKSQAKKPSNAPAKMPKPAARKLLKTAKPAARTSAKTATKTKKSEPKARRR